MLRIRHLAGAALALVALALAVPARATTTYTDVISATYPVYDVRAYTTTPAEALLLCTGAGHDDLPEINAAIAAANAAGGGDVMVPPRPCHTSTGFTLPGNVNLRGAKEGPLDETSTTAGSAATFLVTDTVNPQITVSGNNVTISNLYFHYPNQAAPGVDTPSVYPFTIQVNGGLGVVNVQNVFADNAYDFLHLQAGRSHLDHLHIGALHRGVKVEGVADFVQMDDLMFGPYWGETGGTDAWVAANNIAIQFYHADGMQLSNISGYDGGVGIDLNGSDAQGTSWGEASNIWWDSYTNGITAEATNFAGWYFTNLSIGSTGNPLLLNATSCTSLCDPRIFWTGGALWGNGIGTRTIGNSNANASFNVQNVYGLIGRTVQVGNSTNLQPTNAMIGVNPIIAGTDVTSGSYGVKVCDSATGASATPCVYLRVNHSNGSLEVVNNAYNTVIATFGQSGGAAFPGCIEPGNGSVVGAPESCGGSGVPSFIAPNASEYRRYDGGTGARRYVNQCSPSTSCNSWAAIAGE